MNLQDTDNLVVVDTKITTEGTINGRDIEVDNKLEIEYTSLLLDEISSQSITLKRVKYLIAQGADWKAQNANGLSVKELAGINWKNSNSLEIVDYLSRKEYLNLPD